MTMLGRKKKEEVNISIKQPEPELAESIRRIMQEAQEEKENIIDSHERRREEEIKRYEAMVESLTSNVLGWPTSTSHEVDVEVETAVTKTKKKAPVFDPSWPAFDEVFKAGAEIRDFKKLARAKIEGYKGTDREIPISIIERLVDRIAEVMIEKKVKELAEVLMADTEGLNAALAEMALHRSKDG